MKEIYRTTRVQANPEPLVRHCAKVSGMNELWIDENPTPFSVVIASGTPQKVRLV